MTRALLATAALAAILLSPAQAQDKVTPSWMSVDAGAKKVKMDVTAGWNPNNGALNFNGYYKGGMTVVVPVGWTVDISFLNHDGMLPHSLLVTKAYPPDAMPDVVGVDKVAVPRAYTVSPEQGLPPNGTDTLSFKTSMPGDFQWLCGVAAHATGGMWTSFRVEEAATAPYVTITAGAEPGRT